MHNSEPEIKLLMDFLCVFEHVGSAAGKSEKIAK